MSSVTSPQQTGRGGADIIPGPRGMQDVRLLVLGTDADAQELKDLALAAGFELAQRYSARVSHVAYGAGIDPGDAKYNKIRDAGLVIVPIKACAAQLGLGDKGRAPDSIAAGNIAAGNMDAADARDELDARAEADVRDGADADADAVEAEAASVVAVEDTVSWEDEASDGDAAGPGEPLEFPPLQQVGTVIEQGGRGQRGENGGRGGRGDGLDGERDGLDGDLGDLDGDLGDLHGDLDRDVDGDGELARDVEDAYAPLQSLEPAQTPSPVAQDLPLGAAVIGADPWTGPDDIADDHARASDAADPADITGFIPVIRASDLEAADAPVTETAAPAEPAADPADAAAGTSGGAAAAPPRLSARYVLASLVWALVPFVSFGLLTPVVFGYAALRLRSRILALTTLGYTVAVVLSFALSAARPHAATPSDASGALLTLALAAAWIGGTVHAISLRVRVFAH
jgi:hypothetical protein